MSVQSEITRINNAKSTLSNWLEQQEVPIQQNANITTIADTISQLSLGYELPIASATVLGGIKVGTNLTIDSNGVLSSTGGSSVTIKRW